MLTQNNFVFDLYWYCIVLYIGIVFVYYMSSNRWDWPMIIEPGKSSGRNGWRCFEIWLLSFHPGEFYWSEIGRRHETNNNVPMLSLITCLLLWSRGCCFVPQDGSSFFFNTEFFCCLSLHLESFFVRQLSFTIQHAVLFFTLRFFFFYFVFFLFPLSS